MKQQIYLALAAAACGALLWGIRHGVAYLKSRTHSENLTKALDTVEHLAELVVAGFKTDVVPTLAANPALAKQASIAELRRLAGPAADSLKQLMGYGEQELTDHLSHLIAAKTAPPQES
jgi:hypothetical protein